MTISGKGDRTEPRGEEKADCSSVTALKANFMHVEGLEAGEIKL
jgi:hypothetical protein